MVDGDTLPRPHLAGDDDLRNQEHSLPAHAAAVHQTLPPRPKLVPTFPSASTLTRPSTLPFSLSDIPSNEAAGTGSWVELIDAPAFAPLASWQHVMEQLIRHPERNSTNILRADITQESYAADADPARTQFAMAESRWQKQWTISRTILPRRPNLDWEMQQDCSLYLLQATRKHDDDSDHDAEQPIEEALIVYTPLIGSLSHPRMDLPQLELSPEIGQLPPSEAFVPFYHPKVRALAFRYSVSTQSDTFASPTVFGRLSISIVCFPPQPAAFPATHKLSRVGLSLLTTLHMHTWGHLHSYQKRVHHDQIVPKSTYQDLYLYLKQKYAAQLIEGWAEVTDPQKHVFEDLGIAAFLISLWKIQFGDAESDGRRAVKFVDVGCGNGLLTHILHLEGFQGVGLDLRSRKSWPAYQAVGTRLSEWTFEPSCLSVCQPDDDAWRGAFLIGNHADELTPWIPLLATHYQCTGFVNIPCCYYALEGGKNFPLSLKRAKATDHVDIATISDAAPSRNQQYLAYIANLTQELGWQVELEALRIPSTKNWTFVGRKMTVAPVAESRQYEALRQHIVETVARIHHTWTARVSK